MCLVCSIKHQHGVFKLDEIVDTGCEFRNNLVVVLEQLVQDLYERLLWLLRFVRSLTRFSHCMESSEKRLQCANDFTLHLLEAELCVFKFG